MAEFNQMSTREWEVIEQLLQGKSNKLIAAGLDISVSTVEFHLNNIYEKCHVSSRLELILTLWKASGKMDIKKLGYSPVDSIADLTENGERPSIYHYGRVRKIMRLYRIVLIACVFVILFPLVSLILHKALNPESIIIWRGIIVWLLPAVGILTLLLFFLRKSFRDLVIIASTNFLVLLGIGLAFNHTTDLIFDLLNLRFWIIPYLVGAGGILIAAWSRSREPGSGMPEPE